MFVNIKIGTKHTKKTHQFTAQEKNLNSKIIISTHFTPIHTSMPSVNIPQANQMQPSTDKKLYK